MTEDLVLQPWLKFQENTKQIRISYFVGVVGVFVVVGVVGVYVGLQCELSILKSQVKLSH